MKTLLILSIGLVSLWTASAQNDGRYRPIFPVLPTRRRPSIFDGRFRPQRPVTDGRYRPVGDGRYRGGNDGRYVPRNDGKYVHVDVPGGKYSGDGGQYTGGGGQYSGGGGQYSGGGGQYSGGPNTGGSGGRPSGGASGAGVGTNAGAGAGANAGIINTTRRPLGLDILTQNSLKPTIQGKGTGEGGSGWRIIRDDNSVDSDGYHYLYETENGILAEEEGRVQPLDRGEEGLRSVGFFEYTGDDGLLYRVNYVADNNGFVPEGDHIPKAPPHVAKLLAYLAANAPSNVQRR